MGGRVFSSVAFLGLIATPAMAQSTADAGAGSYLCTVAGKCGDEPAVADAAPVKAAPATKGFRLAAPSGQTTPAPATRGFRLARPANPASTTAPATRGFRLARPTQPARQSTMRRVRPAYTAGAPAYAAAASVPTPGAGTRADLMLSFDYNSDRMTPAAMSKARGFAQALKMPELSRKRFLIEGHTDARGARNVNIDLSRRRAQSVADFLVSQGVDRTRVEVKGVGPDEPLPGRARDAESNRRVEAVLLG